MTSNKPKQEEWVNVEKFIKHYDLSKTLAYRLIHAVGFPCQRVSKRAYRVDLNKTDAFFQKYYSN